MAKSSSGAVHLTSIDLDISKLQADIQTVNADIGSMTSKALEQAEKFKNAFNTAGLGGNRTGLSNTNLVDNKNITASITAIENLNLAYKNFLATLSSTKIDKSFLGDLPSDAKVYADAMSTLTQEIAQSGTVTKEQAGQFQTLQSTLKGLKGQYAEARTASNEFKNSFKDVEQSIKATLPELEKLKQKANFKDEKVAINDLKQQFKNLQDAIKNGGISVVEAQKEFERLRAELSQLESTVGQTESVFTRFTNKVLDFAKQGISNLIGGNLRQAFSQIVPTIMDTENAVIELQRVLNDTSLSNKAISDSLYDMAYRYGQTFDNVSEIALRFAQTGLSWTETLSATEAAMLGLNTAELDVSTATEGLIAVMAQFGYEATDLESIIDKINITADNFPVTSEKIIQALQRVGGTAQAAGLTLEQTISLITGLSEATGRSGANIGTVLNSIISFTTNESAIKKFEEFLGGVTLQGQNPFAIWYQLSKGIEQSGDAMADMMAQSAEFADLFDAEIAEAIGLTGQFNEAVAAGEDVYNAAGTYRKSYFIALLNNIDTAIAAYQNMQEAEGYSLSENEKQMETLGAKWNQFIASAQELAVQLGDAGFLDLLKTLTDIGAGIVKITGYIGGLRTALFAVLTVITMVKAQQISQGIESIIKFFPNLINNLKSIPTQIQNVGTAFQAAEGRAAAFSTTLTGMLPIIGLATTAYSMLSGALEAYRQKQESLRDERIQTGKDAMQEVNANRALTQSFESAAKAYDNSAESRTNLIKASQDLINSFGDEQYSIDRLVDRFESGEISVDEFTESIRNLNEEVQKSNFRDIYKGVAGLESKLAELSQNNIPEWLQKLQTFIPAGAASQQYGSIESSIAEYEKLIADIEKTESKYRDEAGILDELAAARDNKLIQLRDEKKQYDSVLSEIKEYTKALKASGEDTSELESLLEKFGITLKDTASSVDTFNHAMESVPGTLNNVDLESLADEFDNLSKKIDEFQSAYKTLQTVIEEYNETGKISVDNYQALMSLGPEYLDLLEMQNGQLVINEQKYQDLLKVNQEYAQMMYEIKLQELEDYRAKKQLESGTYDVKSATDAATPSVDALRAAIATVASVAGGAVSPLSNMASGLTTVGSTAQSAIPSLYNFANAAIAAANAANSLHAAQVSASGSVGKNIATSWQTSNTLDNLFSAIDWGGGYSGGGGSGGGGGGGGSSKAETLEDRIKELASEFSETLDIYEHAIFLLEKNEAPAEKIVAMYDKMQKEVSAQANKYREMGLDENSKYIRELQKQWWEYFEDKLEALKNANDAELEIYEHQNFLIEKNNGNPDKIVANLRKMQQSIHDLANKYRSMGLDENSEFIRDLQKQWWDLEEEIEEVYDGIFEKSVQTHENVIQLMNNQFEISSNWLDTDDRIAQLNKRIQENLAIKQDAANEANRLRAADAKKYENEIAELSNKSYQAQRDIEDARRQLQDVLLDPFEKMIDLADELDLWDDLGFNKLGYLQDELRVINKLFSEGNMTLADYNDKLRALMTQMYSAYKDDVAKQQEKVQAFYDNEIQKLEDKIKKQEEERKAVSDYYDDLIDDLNKVEKANERINKQLDYYSQRQKIITNIEQTQARSGVEWREKEMQYQQQLIDLDAEWNRTRQEWDIQDQISDLEALKQQALDDIDATIEAIQKEIETTQEACDIAIKRLEDDVTNLGRIIASAVTTGIYNGLVDTDEEFGDVLYKTFDEMLEYINTSSIFALDSMYTASSNASQTYNSELVKQLETQWSDFNSYMTDAIVSGAARNASDAFYQYQYNLIEPLKKALANVYQSVTVPVLQSTPFYSTGSSSSPIARAAAAAANVGNTTNVYITNNNANSSKGNIKTQNVVQSVLQRY